MLMPSELAAASRHAASEVRERLLSAEDCSHAIAVCWREQAVLVSVLQSVNPLGHVWHIIHLIVYVHLHTPLCLWPAVSEPQNQADVGQTEQECEGPCPATA